MLARFAVCGDFSFAVWNLDTLPARDFGGIPLIESLQNTYNFDMFGVCESMLTGRVSNEDVFINGFCPSPFRSDKSSTTRNRGVCLYFKESLPIKERCDLEIIPETVVAEIKLNRKKCIYCSLVLSPELGKQCVYGISEFLGKYL